MHRFFEGLEGEQTDRDLDRAIGHLAACVVREELPEGFDRLSAQALALDLEPLFERRLVQAEAFEQLAPVESDRFVESFRRCERDALLESSDVHDHARRIKTHLVDAGPQNLTVDRFERPAEVEQAIPKPMASGVLARLRPQQRSQLSTGERLGRIE